LVGTDVVAAARDGDGGGIGVPVGQCQQLATSLRVTAAQVRKDLAYFGQFGQPGVGYHVAPLIDDLRRILGTDRTWSVVVVGAGDLGSALLRYRGFRKKGFDVVAAFDVTAGDGWDQLCPFLGVAIPSDPFPYRR
jgi:NADH/NAD ratio-sensing transcriptional regulator Rex